jgi:transcriptional regulator NrdR family protein
MECGAIWTTIESTKGSVTFKVLKDEDMVDFRPEILLISLYEVLKHRKAPELDAQYLFETVTSKLHSLKEPTFSTELIADSCYEVLKNYDKLAADLYKRIHQFTD